jgi:hydrogenase-4 component E
MAGLIDGLILVVVLTNLKLLGSSRTPACIRVVAAQGVLLAALPLLAAAEPLSLQTVIAAVASGLLKGLLLPWLLLRTAQRADVRQELEPLVGYTLSLLIGGGLLVGALWLGRRLPPVGEAGPTLLVPAAMFTLMVGLFMIVARRKALTQVVGYLAMENGIYAFGLAFARSEPLLVELGILLDVFVAVFVMGITIHHISREFDSIDTRRMSRLKD